MNVKQGDLAYVYFPGHKQHMRFVALETYLGYVNANSAIVYAGETWIVAASGPVWGVKACHGSFDDEDPTATRAPCCDAVLRPVGGVPLDGEGAPVKKDLEATA
jgi:hypothetical protein